MGETDAYDAAVVGGGIMGCTTALHLARGGMRVVVLERRPGLCMEASSANTGALMLQLIRAALIPYAIRSIELWRTAPGWLGRDMGYRNNGGLTLAFTEREAEMLEAWMANRRAAGAPIEIIDGRRARAIEPAIGEHVILASHCRADGYADATVTGLGYRLALLAAGVEVREGTAVETVERVGAGFTLRVAGGRLAARRLVLAGGVWLAGMSRWFGLEFPVECRVNQVSVTERVPPMLGSSICTASGRLSLKQTALGTVLIGGGWQGVGSPEAGAVRIIPENLVGNLRLACHAVPALAGVRLVRSWLGLEAKVPDYMPVIGAVPGTDDAFIIGCVHAGYTLGPLLGTLLAERILGLEPEMPLAPAFDPARLLPDRMGALEVWETRTA